MLKVYHLYKLKVRHEYSGNYCVTVLLFNIHTNAEMFLWDVNKNNLGVFLGTQNGTIMKMWS